VGTPLLPGLPLLGPGPVTNRSRRTQIFDIDGRPRLPGTKPLLVDHPSQQVGDYTNPILKSDATEIVKRLGELELSGKGHPTPWIECWPSGVPFIFENVAMQILQRPDKITIVYEFDHEVRHVRMNHSHPAPPTPSWYGGSVGHYEGDTLVIDTVGVKTDRPVAMLDLYGTPYTKALHVSNVIGCLITTPRKRHWSVSPPRIGALRRLGLDRTSTLTTRAMGCSSSLR
jgi:hypothetical protein